MAKEKRAREDDLILNKKKKKTKKDIRAPPRKLATPISSDKAHDAPAVVVSQPSASQQALQPAQLDTNLAPPMQDTQGQHAGHDDDDNEGQSREAKKQRKKMSKLIANMTCDFKSKEISKALERHHDQARMLGRMAHPFMHPLEALNFGINYGADDPESDIEDSDSDAESDERTAELKEKAHRRELLYQYHAILDLIPDLKHGLQYVDEDDLDPLGDYLKSRINAARGDDSSALRKIVITYMQDSLATASPEFRTAPSSIEKVNRGWNNWYTARLICPISMIEDFGADWERFSDRVQQGEIKIYGDDFPALMFNEQEREQSPDSLYAGLLRSEYLLMCYKSLWTGPGSAKLPGGRMDRTPGKPPIAMKYKLSSVSPRSIAYTVVLVRCELSSQTNFKPVDSGSFDAGQLFNEVVELFENPESTWCKETLQWWNERVYGNISHSRAPAVRPPGLQTIADKLRAARRAERKAARAAEATRSSLTPRSSSPSAGLQTD